MGGYGSGRQGGRPTTDDGLTLDLARLLRQRSILPRRICVGSLTWTNTRTGEAVSSIGYEAELDDQIGHIRLRYTTTCWNGETRDADYSVTLTTTPQPFGGRRWWFVCPRLGLRVAKLHLPSGAPTFASRKAYRLAYRSQRETPHDRAYSRAFKLRRRLGADGGIGDPVRKPKGMRWATFEREKERLERDETVCDALLVEAARKLGIAV